MHSFSEEWRNRWGPFDDRGNSHEERLTSPSCHSRHLFNKFLEDDVDLVCPDGRVIPASTLFGLISEYLGGLIRFRKSQQEQNRLQQEREEMCLDVPVCGRLRV